QKHSLTSRELKISDDAIYAITEAYTREAGVRSLEKQIASLCRKATVMLEEGAKSVRVNADNIEEFLGKKKYSPDKVSAENLVGTVNGLAWTSVGGTMLPIEVSALDGTGKIELTGNLGDIMKESAKTAVSYVRSMTDCFGIEKDFYKTKDIHIHTPEAAVPKDGPSAGLAITTALVSELTGIPIKSNVAMTGEISLKGKALAIGGLKEKSMAAYKAGCDTVIIPKENQKDLADISDEVKQSVNFICVSDFEEILPLALTRMPKKIKNSDADREGSVVVTKNSTNSSTITQ
ncbi:MAG: S16 family serine protease, partial [Eubacterium sp.]